ncbi:hypothetical protein NEUTE1DRAFT_93525 [Neurospora tetrasperma FGSC 2508]|uniref:Uncharacterized protein n=1 Tax=Neurospora tetrasperma (strain FGSC 2508 / ATCC MYA-4615 / P0657) TaxID=510951 RepID=F8MB44_NEUT8|nr:uncharacterized protein NEUTE1DRAFT_93525 [Neurospora tetrasperma FGSC 2508]EGO60209.1 hypothetical protein NEUTE1DRAFT_93525 [Neurospora tetrasperma FGSC 2508]EGZ75831.1 hypothetical protein NEUTE2DRAFT_120483 [Neurospora tetrasperma FGSC 2509]
MAPLAAFTMAWVLFAYTRHSIQAAKLNAKLAREQNQQQQHHQQHHQQDGVYRDRRHSDK